MHTVKRPWPVVRLFGFVSLGAAGWIAGATCSPDPGISATAGSGAAGTGGTGTGTSSTGGGKPGTAGARGSTSTGPGGGFAGIKWDGGGPDGPGTTTTPLAGNCMNIDDTTAKDPCPKDSPTVISGTVYDPAANNPIYNVVVYVPSKPLDPIASGASCERCESPISGKPIAATLTNTKGEFSFAVPACSQSLVLQVGKWRRQIPLTNINSCQENKLTDKNLTRLPRDKSEGNIPLIAMVTGRVDTFECVLRKIGVADSEFTTPSSDGRVHLYQLNGGTAGPGTPLMADLMSNPATLAKYDMVIFACEGGRSIEVPAHQQNLIAYANAGGRVFATHYSYTWLDNVVPFSQTAAWNRRTNPQDPLMAMVDTSFPKGQAFAEWLVNVGASPTLGQLTIANPTRHNVDRVVPPSLRWIHGINMQDKTMPPTVQHYTFLTPVGTPPNMQCGKVLFSDFHVEDSSNLMPGTVFPAQCNNNPMTPQVKALEFMVFDLGSCIQIDDEPPKVPQIIL